MRRAAGTWRLAALATLMVSVLASCSGGDAGSCGGIIEPSRTLTLAPQSLSLDPGSDTLATARVDGGCTSDDRTVRWSVADPAIATVDGSGRISAVASGSTTVTASAFSDRATARLAVTVRPRVATTLVVTPRVDTLSPLGTRALTSIVTDQTGTLLPSATVSYRSLSPNVATVSSSGSVSAIAAGAAAIEASTQKTGADSLRDTVRIVVVAACTRVRPLAIGTTVSGTIDVSGCQNFQGYRVVNQFSVTSSSQTYFSARLTPTAGPLALVPLLVNGIGHGLPAADTAVTAFVVARAGTNPLFVTAPSTNSVPYTLTTQLDPDPRTLCVPTDVTFNVAFRTALTPTCLGRDVRLLPPLAIGQVVRITGVAAGFPVTLELRNAPSGTLLQRAVATTAGAQATITYTNGLTSQLVRVRVIGPAAANDFVTITVSP